MPTANTFGGLSPSNIYSLTWVNSHHKGSVKVAKSISKATKTKASAAKNNRRIWNLITIIQWSRTFTQLMKGASTTRLSCNQLVILWWLSKPRSSLGLSNKHLVNGQTISMCQHSMTNSNSWSTKKDINSLERESSHKRNMSIDRRRWNWIIKDSSNTKIWSLLLQTRLSRLLTRKRKIKCRGLKGVATTFGQWQPRISKIGQLGFTSPRPSDLDGCMCQAVRQARAIMSRCSRKIWQAWSLMNSQAKILIKAAQIN